ncbi:transporter substrate-binding domain-containing protein [uncultured Flavonifractor sp.]|uniref:transporter substrate-binding domain-containing protein n=1 Tax=uncultured Flavonifractor sp. TaxID=1193534 RepID=UPI00260753A7|nr:transporter substrate-binding domain-containing protein [uncultured Flavonifractor sp.]
MKLKRLIPSILSLALVFSLAACGSGGSGSANTPAQNETTPAQSETTPAQTEGDGSLQRVLDAGKLTIGAEGNWIPYVYNEDGTGDLTGFEVEVAKEVAARLGVEAEFQISDSWDPVLAGLDAARYDIVICGVNPNPERQEKYACTIAYAENPYCLVVNGDNTEITSFDDLDGKLCINSPSSAAGQIAQRYGATTADGDLTAAMEQLNTGRADAHVNNVAAVDAYMAERPDVNVKIAATYEPEEENRYEIESAAMLRKEDQELCDKVSEILQSMIDDGTLYDLTVKYFGEAVADSTSIYQK